MKRTIYEKYAALIANYCLYLKKDERVFIRTTYLAEPLLKPLHQAILKTGAHPHYDIGFEDQSKLFFDVAQDNQLEYVDPFSKMVMEEFDAYLVIRAPFNLRDTQGVDPAKMKKKQEAGKGLYNLYSQRTAEGSMKRTLCEFPTSASAQNAGMSLSEYEDFIFSACHLYDEHPEDAWKAIGVEQQKAVDYLNQRSTLRYKNPNTDISFSIAGRIWMNSDGKTNMPSGEVFSSPVEDTVNGHITFDFPSVFRGQEVEGIRLEVKDGEVVKWDAKRGIELLDQIFDIPGARYFGEVAIATNYGIQRPTKNILFDEKIGGTIHMAIGQTYLQTGGKNQSSVHWDMIADMKDGGQIYADDELIYENGRFLI